MSNETFNPETHWLGTCECMEDWGVRLNDCNCREGKVLPKTICICANKGGSEEHNRRYIHLPEEEAAKERAKIYGETIEQE